MINETYTGHCSYCQQSKIVEAPSEAEANSMATMECNCNEGAKFRRILKIHNYIDEITENIDTKTRELLRNNLKNLAEQCFECNIRKATIGISALETDITFSISKTTKGDIKVLRKNIKQDDAKL